MKLREIITEIKQGKITRRQQQSSRGINVYSDKQKANTDYVGFKLGQAMGATDGTFAPEIDATSWFGKKKTVHPYTQQEQDKFEKAAKEVGAEYKDLTKGDLSSQELETINKTSPVAKIKKNKYGI